MPWFPSSLSFLEIPFYNGKYLWRLTLNKAIRDLLSSLWGSAWSCSVVLVEMFACSNRLRDFEGCWRRGLTSSMMQQFPCLLRLNSTHSSLSNASGTSESLCLLDACSNNGSHVSFTWTLIAFNQWSLSFQIFDLDFGLFRTIEKRVETYEKLKPWKCSPLFVFVGEFLAARKWLRTISLLLEVFFIINTARWLSKQYKLENITNYSWTSVWVQC